jgi:hypothetical protein
MDTTGGADMTITRKDFLKMLGAGALGAHLPAGKAMASPKMQTARADAKKLKIQDVEIYYFDIPLKEPFKISLGTITTSSGVLIRVITDAGIIGLANQPLPAGHRRHPGDQHRRRPGDPGDPQGQRPPGHRERP